MVDTPEISNTSYNATVRRLRLICIVAGLLLVEYLFQFHYYQHQSQQQHSSDGVSSWWYQPSAVVIPKSDQFISDLKLRTCRFPVYYDKSHFDFRLNDKSFVEPGDWRERNQVFYGREDARHVRYYLQKTEKQRKESAAMKPLLPPITRNLTLVHIGKAGGSTVACVLRWGRMYIKHHCDNVHYDPIDNSTHDDPPTDDDQPYIPESAISRHVNCYTHWRMVSQEIKTNESMKLNGTTSTHLTSLHKHTASFLHVLIWRSSLSSNEYVEQQRYLWKSKKNNGNW
jgi:hypothetical protein